MGYYSEVALALKPDAYKRLMQKKEVKAPEEYESSVNKEKLLYWQETKWYEDDPEYFPDVYTVEEFMKEEESRNYLFVRIGEDAEDIEWKGMYWDNPFSIEIVRKIDFDPNAE